MLSMRLEAMRFKALVDFPLKITRRSTPNPPRSEIIGKYKLFSIPTELVQPARGEEFQSKYYWSSIEILFTFYRRSMEFL